MPFASRQQQRFAFATHQPWAKRWADETDFAGLPERARHRKGWLVARRAARNTVAQGCADCPLHQKAVTQRIAGNLCRVGGKFAACDAGGNAAPAAGDSREAARERGRERARERLAKLQARRGGKGRGGRARKPAKTDAERQAEREAKRQQREAERVATRDQTLRDTGLSDQDRAALVAGRAGDTLSAGDGPRLAAQGLAEQAADGSYRLTAAARSIVDAATRGDAGAVRDRLSAAADRAARAKEPRGGGGGGKKKPDASATATQTAPQIGMAAADLDALRNAAEGRATNNVALEQQGLIVGGEATDAGRRLLRALERGDVRGALAAIQDGKAAVARGQARTRREQERRAALEQRRREREARKRQQEQARIQRDQERTARQRRRLSLIARRARAGLKLSPTQQDQLVEAGLAEYADGGIRLKASGNTGVLDALTVVKQADGRWRWTMISSTAYQDRDGEWITKQALALDCARADRDGDYGPLLWWHTPFELGTCDWNAVAGPLLYESGPFHDEATGAAIASRTSQLGGSIGFRRLPWEVPGPGRAYTIIRRKERSLLPRSAASNPFTDLTVAKETTDMEPDKLKELAKLLNVSEADAQAMVDKQLADTQKAAAARGIVAKQVGGMGDESAADEAGADDMAMEEESDGGGSLFSPEELAEIASAVAPAVAQAVVEALGPTLNMEAKMRGMMDEMKGMIGGGATATKEVAAERARIDKLELELKEARDRLATLEGDQPASFYRPSLAGDTTLGAVIKAATESGGENADPFGRFLNGLGIKPAS